MRATIPKLKSYFMVFLRHCFTHKVNIFAKSIYIPINLFILGFVWIVLYQYNPTIPINYVLSYYFLNFMINAIFPYARLAREIQEEIFTGKFSLMLTRPVNYLIPKIALACSWSFVYMLFVLPMILIFLLISNAYSVERLLLFLIFLIGGQIINFQIWVIIGLISFWTKKNLGIIKINYTLSSLLSANLIPFTLIPVMIQNIFNLTPYKYIVYYPISILIDSSIRNCGLDFGILICWITFFAISIKIIFNKGVYQYEANSH